MCIYIYMCVCVCVCVGYLAFVSRSAGARTHTPVASSGTRSGTVASTGAVVGQAALLPWELPLGGVWREGLRWEGCCRR